MNKTSENTEKLLSAIAALENKVNIAKSLINSNASGYKIFSAIAELHTTMDYISELTYSLTNK